MLRMRNKYCSNCLCTQRFHDLGDHLICERCMKRLEVILPPPPAPAPGQIVPWAEHTDIRREAM